MKTKLISVQDMTLIAMFTALIAICSWISVPLGPVPFTLQTFGIFVTAGILGTRRGIISVLVYICIGVIGIPVFAGFSSGPGVIAGPTGGFILGFFFIAVVVGTMTHCVSVEKQGMKIVVLVIGMILGDVLCFALGTVWFVWNMKSNVATALGLCVVPYIVPDLIKIGVAAVVVNRIKKYTKIFNEG